MQVLFYVQAVFLSCVSVSGLWGLKHAQKASGVLISELVGYARRRTFCPTIIYGGQYVLHSFFREKLFQYASKPKKVFFFEK